MLDRAHLFGVEPEVEDGEVVFRFALEVGMVALTGTTDAGHMRDDLAVLDFRLDPEEVGAIEHFGRP